MCKRDRSGLNFSSSLSVSQCLCVCSCKSLLDHPVDLGYLPPPPPILCVSYFCFLRSTVSCFPMYVHSFVQLGANLCLLPCRALTCLIRSFKELASLRKRASCVLWHITFQKLKSDYTILSSFPVFICFLVVLFCCQQLQKTKLCKDIMSLNRNSMI